MSLLDDLVSYVDFNDGDQAALRAFRPHAAPHFRDIASKFYERILTDRAAREVFADQAQVDRLKLTLVGWLDRLLGGPWDLEYFRLRTRIGRVHVEVELPQRFMLVAMSTIRVELHRLALSSEAPDPEGLLSALGKILDIDLAIMLESYREDTLRAVRRLEEIEKRLLTDELEASEERYRALLDAAEVMVLSIGAGGELQLFNRHAEAVSGYRRTEILDAVELIQLWHPEDAAAIQTAITGVAGGGPAAVEERRLLARTGEVRWVRWHIARIAGGGATYLVGIELTKERELLARTAAAERLATVGTLAAGLAHEIRNPLNAAQLQLTLARRRLSRSHRGGIAAGLEAAALVQDELGRLADLVRDFLAYARPAPLRTRATDLREVIRHVGKLLGPDAHAAGVTIELRAPEVVSAHCDEDKIKQVLFNLVRNGIEAAGNPGRVAIEVSRHGAMAVLDVLDTGPGVPDDLDIFQPFATSKDGGTGLGLSIVERIVIDHGGSIAASRRGDRTVVRVEIPVGGPRTN